MSGSTAEVAQAIGEEIARDGLQADVLPLEKVTDPAACEAVVLGAPMLMGCHRSATKFLKQHRRALGQTPLPRLFVMLVVQAQPGDRRNWLAIRSWAGSLPQLFNSRCNGK
jgi:menaquinone-dependent protoporphyrinogen IX oxidase